MSGILQSVTGVTIRDVTRDDQHYICETWFRSVMTHGNRCRSRRNEVNEQIDRILDDSSTRALIACDLADQDRIVGWIVYSTAPIARVLHYAYVRKQEREKGIARRLVQAAWPTSNARFVVTMKGPDTRSIMEKKRASFVPVEEFLR